MKKIFAIMLSIFIILSSFPLSASAVSSGTTGDCKWIVNGTILTISGNGAMGYYNKYTDEHAPWGTSITEVIIENGVTNIGEYAFYNCENLIKVVIPDSVNVIQTGAFSECSNLVSIDIPDSVTTIDFYAFEFCEKLSNVKIGNNVMTIGGNAFLGCTSLKEIILPNSLIEINECAFGCSSIETLDIPSNVTTIYDNTFSGCSKLKSIYVSEDNKYFADIEGVLFDKSNEKLIYYPSGRKDLDYYIPNKVKIIGKYAFSNNAISSIKVSDCIEKIEENAFDGCNNISNIIVSENNNYYCDIDGVLFNKEKTELVYYPEGRDESAYIIPNSVTKIGSYAFSDCLNLTEIVIPDTVNSIGYFALVNTGWYKNQDDGLIYAGKVFCGIKGSVPEKITIKKGTVGIADKACYYYNNLTSVTLPNTITNIGDYAFYGCTNIIDINFPNNLINIGKYAFANFNCFEEILLPDTVVNISESAFSGCENLVTVITGDGVRTIGNSAFSNCQNLLNTSLSNKLTYIGDRAFSNCPNLMEISLPETVISIGESVFASCNKLTNIIVSEKNNYYCDIDGVLFDKNKITIICYPAGKNLSSYIIPEGITVISNSAFSRCKNIERISIPNSVLYIGDSAFTGCSKLSRIAIPNGVKEIKDSLFAHCDNLTSVVLGNNVSSIGRMSFYECKLLKDIIIPNSVIDIGYFSFGYCSNLKNLVIPASVKKIDEAAFYKCSNLQSIVIYGNASIGKFSFGYCSSLDTVGISERVISIGDYAFAYCNGIKKVYYTGTEEQWKAIYTGSENNCLLSANRSYRTCLCGTSIVWTKIKEPTCKTKGLEKSICQTCDYQMTRELEHLNHKLENSSCIFCGVESYVIESLHPYENNTNYTWDFLKENAMQIEMHFSVETSVERGYDFVLIYDMNDTLIGEYTGTELAGKIIKVDGDAVKINLISDESDNAYGFYVELVPVYQWHYINGDINEDEKTNLKDLVMIAQYVSGWENLSVNSTALDVNGDNKIDLQDVTHLARYLAGWNVTLN